MKKAVYVTVLASISKLGCTYSEQKKKPNRAGESLTENVAPASDFLWLQDKLITQKCAGCHTSTRSLGGFDFENSSSLLAAIAKGGITPGAHGSSLISQVIMSGEMPPPGVEPRPTEKEISILNCWIDRGAVESDCICWERFAGLPNAEPMPTPASTPPEKLPPTTTSDFEWLSAELFQNHCGLCHTQAKPRGGYDLSSRDGVLKAIISGVTPGNHATSPLSQAIMAGRMPPAGAPSRPSEMQVQVLNCWIDSGATQSGDGCLKATAPAVGPSPTPVPSNDLSYATLNRKVLAPYCVGCHNKANAISNVNLSSISTILNPVRGPVLVKCGKPRESLLFSTIEENEMPYEENALPTELKKLVFDWIEKGCEP